MTTPLEQRVASEQPEERLMKAVERESWFYLKQPMHSGQQPPTPIQVAIVLHALADHTAIMGMLVHRPDPGSPWPHATSVGRWFHDVGHLLEDMEPIDPTTKVTDVATPDSGANTGVSNPPTEVEKAEDEIDRILSHYDLFFVSEQAMNNGRAIAKAALTRNRDIYAVKAIIFELETAWAKSTPKTSVWEYLAERLEASKVTLATLEGTQDNE